MWNKYRWFCCFKSIWKHAVHSPIKIGRIFLFLLSVRQCSIFYFIFFSCDLKLTQFIWNSQHQRYETIFGQHTSKWWASMLTRIGSTVAQFLHQYHEMACLYATWYDSTAICAYIHNVCMSMCACVCEWRRPIYVCAVLFNISVVKLFLDDWQITYMVGVVNLWYQSSHTDYIYSLHMVYEAKKFMYVYFV